MYIYNVTISTTYEIGQDILYYVQHRLFPQWKNHAGWKNGRLLSIPQPKEDGVAIAVQFEISDASKVKAFDLESDPCVQRIRQAYGQHVFFHPTIMQVIG